MPRSADVIAAYVAKHELRAKIEDAVNEVLAQQELSSTPIRALIAALQKHAEVDEEVVAASRVNPSLFEGSLVVAAAPVELAAGVAAKPEKPAVLEPVSELAPIAEDVAENSESVASTRAGSTAPSRPPPDASGSCYCGAVTVECSGAPVAKAFCHCVSCRKHGGGAGQLVVLYATKQVTFPIPHTSRTPLIYTTSLPLHPLSV